MAFKSGDDEAASHDPSNKGPIKNRSCTDIICLLLFLAFIGGWVAIGIWGFQRGDPLLLVYPSDSQGRVCGRGDNEDKKYLLFFNLMKCFTVSAVAGCPTMQVCVKNCPNSTYSPYEDSLLPDLPLIDKNTEIKTKLFPYCSDKMKETDITNPNINYKDLIANQVCPPWYIKSGSVLGRCMPFVPDNMSDNDTIINGFGEDGATHDKNSTVTLGQLKEALQTLAKVLNLRNVGEKILNDLAESWWIIGLVLLIACGVSFLWIILMRFVAAFMIWTSLILSLALTLLSAVFCGFKYTELKDAGNKFHYTTELSAYLDLATTWMIFLVISGIMFLIILILLVFFRTRIKIAIELIEEASIAVGDMMSTLFFPIIPFVLEILLVGWFIGVAIYLASSGVPQYQVSLKNGEHCTSKNVSTGLAQNWNYGDGCNPGSQTNFTCTFNKTGEEKLVQCLFHKYGPTETANYFQFYNIFGLLWGLFFLAALDEMVLAGCFASWYWTMDKSKTPRFPLLASFYRTLRYHIGTLAFGALIIAIIRMIRLMLEYVEEKLKQYHQENPLVKAVLCCCKCCFWCLEKFMKFVNRNAYIMTAVYGKNFCWSAKEAFSLLFRNIARVFVLDKVTDYLLFLGKIVIVGGIGIASFYVFSGRLNYFKEDLPQLNYYFVPVILITLGTFYIANIFFGVYAMGVDTLFLCFLEDIERNDGSMERPYFMSRDLRKILGKMENKSQPSSPAK